MTDRMFIIGQRCYNIAPPTVKKMILAGEYLTKLPEGDSFKKVFQQLDKDLLLNALSCLIEGDLSLTKELSYGTKDELVEAISVLFEEYRQVMRQFVSLAESLCLLIAQPK